MSQTLSDRAMRYGSERCAFFTCIAVACIVAAALLGATSRVAAFSNPQDFGRYATADAYSLGLGGGRYYTGSPADAYSCDSCHSHPSGYSFPLVQKGLPLDGYVPDTAYKIELSSPAATAAWVQAASLDPPNDPVTTLTAEFIAENGESAGTISFPSQAEMSNVAFPNLWCTGAKTSPPEKLLNEYGMFIYAQDSGSLPIEITAANGTNDGRCTVGRGVDETGEDYERRCIMALRPCGAQSIKFIWTSPSKWAGPIWFSAGFVTTYDRSTKPNDNDFATVMTVPLNPSYAGATHETVLDSGCSVLAARPLGSRAGSSRGVALTLTGLLSFVAARSRKRQVRGSVDSRFAWSRWVSLLILFACIGCSDGKGLVTEVGGSVGAYEVSTCNKKCLLPITCRKSDWPDAGTPESAAMARMSAMKMSPAAAQNPFAMAAAAGGGAAGGGAPAVPSLGTVALQFVSAQPAGLVSNWRSKCPKEMPTCDPNYVAVWIESEDKEYVRTLHDQKGMYIDLSLLEYKGLGSDCESNPQETPDVTATATKLLHGPYMLKWDGLYGSGHKAAPAGTYHIKIEVAIDETHPIEVADIPFMFGEPAPYTTPVPPASAHMGATLTYTPGAMPGSTPAITTTTPTSTP